VASCERKTAGDIKASEKRGGYTLKRVLLRRNSHEEKPRKIEKLHSFPRALGPVNRRSVGCAAEEPGKT